ncbi:ABC transporter ATP-binding protein [Xylocopilactobacillus apicola]|uniref:Multidrug ABC transporter ATP-binding protein n=1 Tax=Xylocopilactobacillus apicola TaxID=2932184 RepID=A0AAU9DUV3_9LACO|nr:ABC transporter ATP-binding protein [Xylocopilactobacillus apicola]BDR59303.1 multidrug ABC transporter ATP-binding protein [Xylocopilactobacillus apicola]
MIKLSKSRVKNVLVFLSIVFMIVQVVTTLMLPNYTSDMINNGIAKNNTGYIVQAGMKMLGVTVIFILAAIGNVYCAAQVSQGFGKELRSDIYSKVLNMSRGEFDKVGTASLITRTTNDVNQIQNVTMMALRMMIQSPIMLIGASVMAYRKEAKLTSVFLVAIPVLIVFVGLILYFATPLFKSLQKKTDRINLIFREGLTGVRVIRAFRQDDFEQNRFDEANKDYTNTARKVFSLVSLMFPVMTLVMSGTNIGITWQASHLIGNIEMQMGNLVAFITYAMQILMSFMMLSMVFFLVPRAQASAARINEILDSKSELKETSSPTEIPTEIMDLSLEFKNVDFFYGKAKVPALSGVNLTMNQGQTLAIIGGTGSGKSTMINLIPRIYDATHGSVKINGIDVKDTNIDALQDHVSLVPQKSVLFKGTVRSNLLFGDESATDEQLWHALEVAQASDFVKELPGQLDGVVEQGGDNFSGGQKQRLAIARALVKSADIYIFDDSFSALDFKTDALLRQALKDDERIKNKIVVIVGQRVSTVASADQIVVLDDGKMVGLGTHQELKKNNEVYQDIVNSQIKEGDQ